MKTKKKAVTSSKNAGFVYFLEESLHKSIKIGCTQNLNQRITEFVVKLPFELELVHVIYSENHKETETLLHKHYKEKQLNGEWFRLGSNDLMMIKKMQLPNKIVDSITGEKVKSAQETQLNQKVIRLHKEKYENIVNIPINQIKINNDHFVPKKTKLEKYKNKIKDIDGPLVKVRVIGNDFVLTESSPYFLEAAKALKNFIVSAVIV